MATIMLAGCGGNTSTDRATDDIVSSKEIVSTGSTHKTFFNEHVPEPKAMFPELEVNITDPASNGKYYGYYANNATHDDFVKYVDSIDKDIFSVEYYLENSYNTSTAEKMKTAIQSTWISMKTKKYIFVSSRYVEAK